MPGLKSMFLQASNAHMHADKAASHSAHLAPSAQTGLSGRADRAYRHPTNMQPSTFCYHWLSSG